MALVLPRRLLGCTGRTFPCLTLSLFITLLSCWFLLSRLEMSSVKTISDDSNMKTFRTSWPTWISQEIQSGRWALPHEDAFCPKPAAFGIKYKVLPENLPGSEELIRVTDEFVWLYHNHAQDIKSAFDKGGNNVLVTHRFPNGSPCRSQLRDTSFLDDACCILLFFFKV